MNKSTKAFFGMLGAALGLGILNGPAKADKTFTVGTPATESFFKWTVSDNGNLYQFQTANDEAIQLGVVMEGYQLASQRIGGYFVDGYDVYSSNNGGFDTAVVATTGLPVDYVYRSTRKTGALLGAVKLKLQQDFKPDTTTVKPTGSRGITINITVTNLESSTVNNVFLSRIVDFDMRSSGGSSTENWGRTKDAVLQYVANGPGIYLQGFTFTQATGTYVDTFGNNSAALGTAPPNLVSLATPVTGDHAGRVFYNLGSLAPGASKTVKFIYRRL